MSSQRIGTYAMEKLKSVDEVAYVRFASVYRQFKDINSFMEELSKIINSKKSKGKAWVSPGFFAFGEKVRYRPVLPLAGRGKTWYHYHHNTTQRLGGIAVAQ